MREISLDTETTGLSHEQGDRIVEIGCVELDNLLPTGRTFHVYIDPERAMSEGATSVTGITDADLRGKPKFAEISDAFREFIDGAHLIIHNAKFDVGFINAEFRRVGAPPLDERRVVDTLAMARKRFPGAQSSLDALCRRFGVDNSAREKHGALLDAELLADVYLELRGGRQPGLTLASDRAAQTQGDATSAAGAAARRPGPRPQLLTESEAEAHAEFIASLADGGRWPTA